ncbi:hypothetical protein GCM10025792_30850 [Pseudonocardia tropica]
MRGESLIVATSNHAEALDPAIWRRFDEIIRLRVLGVQQIESLIRLKCRQLPVVADLDRWARELMGNSPAEVELVCMDALRYALLEGTYQVDDAAFSHAHEGVIRRMTALADAAATEEAELGEPS